MMTGCLARPATNHIKRNVMPDRANAVLSPTYPTGHEVLDDGQSDRCVPGEDAGDVALAPALGLRG